MVKYNVESSKIEFSVMGFIGTISTILVLVLGFYSYVIEPRISMINQKLEKQEMINDRLQQSISQLNYSIVELNVTVREFKDR